MRHVVLAPTDVEVTGLGFGCARLMRSPSSRERQAALEAAFDGGVTHFDVARMYGLGAAEAELGRFVKGRRAEVTIATKFGIEPGAGAGRLAPIQAPARWLMARFPALRRQVKRRADAHIRPTYDASVARASLETSLRELGTDYLDIFFLHGPPEDAVQRDEVCAFLEEARQGGLIRAWGVSGEPVPSAALVDAFPVPTVLQVRDDAFIRATELLGGGNGRALSTFGLLAEPLQRLLGHLRKDTSAQRRWNEALGEDCSTPEAIASLLLRDAVDRNLDGVVLFASTRPEHIRSAIVAGTRTGPDPGVDAFRALVRADFAEPASVQG